MLLKILKFWAKHSRVELITGHGDPNSVYLVRYHLCNNRFFKLYLHHFLRSDRDEFHDHPWNFWTYMLQGDYFEDIYDWRTRTFKTIPRTTWFNQFVYRPADHLHRVRVWESHTVEQKDLAPMTLFFATKKTREWGFVRDYDTAPKWTHWKEYLGIK